MLPKGPRHSAAGHTPTCAGSSGQTQNKVHQTIKHGKWENVPRSLFKCHMYAVRASGNCAGAGARIDACKNIVARGYLRTKCVQ